MRKACRYPLYLSIHQFQQRSQDTCYQADEFIPRPPIFCTPTNGKTLLGFRGTFSQAGKPCSVPEEHFPKRGNLARFPRDIFPSGETLLAFRGTFSRAGKPCSVSEEHFPGRENLARFQGNIFQGGESLPRSWGTFSQAGKPCSVSEGHFPGRGNLARLVGNVFPSGKTLPGSWGTFSRAGKPCRAARQAFNDNMLTAVFSFSLTSGRMRYAPTVFGEILTRNDTIHHRTPNKSMVNM